MGNPLIHRHETYRKYYLADFWRNYYFTRIRGVKHCSYRFGYRHTLWTSNTEAGHSGALAIRERNQEQGGNVGMPLYDHECHLAPDRRYLDLFVAHGVRTPVVHYHHRDPIWDAAF